MKTKNKLVAPRGFSLVELMVAIVLGLVLMAGVVQVFIGNRQAQRSDSAVSRVQEGGRLALDLITADLRAAGFYGCPVILDIEKDVAKGEELKIFDSDLEKFVSANFADASVRGYEHPSASQWLSTSAVPMTWAGNDLTNAKIGSDVVALYFGEAGKARITAAFGPTASIPASIDSNSNYFDKDDAVIVSNCQKADLFRITNEPADTGNISLSHTGVLSADYDEHSKLMKFIEHVYYVKDTGRKNPAGNRIFSLYRLNNGTSEELIEGVEFLQMQFGEKLTSGNIRFVSADDASLDPSRIVSVKIGVLAQSYDAAAVQEDSREYDLPGQKIDASTTSVTHGADKTIRRMFTATVELRNRLQL
jgi:type IV pilus assembly protein PilW